ncbi:unnamed protein product [Brassica oleracea var. botrytis]
MNNAFQHILFLSRFTLDGNAVGESSSDDLSPQTRSSRLVHKTRPICCLHGRHPWIPLRFRTKRPKKVENYRVLAAAVSSWNSHFLSFPFLLLLLRSLDRLRRRSRHFISRELIWSTKRQIKWLEEELSSKFSGGSFTPNQS